MSDLIADLRQKLADWGDNAELRLDIERDEWGVMTHFLDSQGPLSGWTVEATNEWHRRRRALAFDVSEARAANEGRPA